MRSGPCSVVLYATGPDRASVCAALRDVVGRRTAQLCVAVFSGFPSIFLPLTLSARSKERSGTYLGPLNAKVGPRLTECINIPGHLSQNFCWISAVSNRYLLSCINLKILRT